jgi:hypothetical protein
MLEGVVARSSLLNSATGLVEQEYQRARIRRSDAAPERYLAGPDVGRECPAARRCEPP